MAAATMVKSPGIFHRNTKSLSRGKKCQLYISRVSKYFTIMSPCKVNFGLWFSVKFWNNYKIIPRHTWWYTLLYVYYYMCIFYTVYTTSHIGHSRYLSLKCRFICYFYGGLIWLVFTQSHTNTRRRIPCSSTENGQLSIYYTSPQNITGIAQKNFTGREK